MTTLAISAFRAARGIDRVVIAILAMVALLALLSPDQALESIAFTGRALVDVSIFLLLSVGVAAYAKASGSDRLIAKAFSGRTGTMIVAASLMGALSPFCSCGVIPLIAALLAMGVPLPAVMAFWLASPIMDPSMFVLTAGTLGPTFALYKTFAAVVMGLLGGFGTAAAMGSGWFRDPLRPGIGDGGCAASAIRSDAPPVWRFWTEQTRRDAFRRTGLETIGVLGKGLALAFLLAGGVTSIPAAIAVYALARPPVFIAYLTFALVGSLGLGVGFGLLA